MIIKSKPHLGKIIIRGGNLGWPNKKIGNKKHELECDTKIKSFIDENIHRSPDNFITYKDVKNLFNVRYSNFILNDIDLSKKLQKFIQMIRSKLGWHDKCIEYKDENKEKNTDLWREFIDKYIIEDENSCILWKTLRSEFREWHDDIKKYKPRLSSYGSEAKNYFSHNLNGFKDSSRFFNNAEC